MVSRRDEAERARYERAYARALYRTDGCAHDGGARRFLEACRPAPGDTVLDVGCGTGRAAARILAPRGLVPTLVDIARNAPDRHIAEAYDWRPGAFLAVTDGLERWDWVYSIDVFEHFPPDEAEAALGRALDVAREGVYLEVATFPDQCGAILDVGPLHLTVRPATWWRDAFQEAWSERDLSGTVRATVTGRHARLCWTR